MTHQEHGSVAMGDSREAMDAWHEFVYALPEGDNPLPSKLFLAGYSAALSRPVQEPVAWIGRDTLDRLNAIHEIRAGFITGQICNEAWGDRFNVAIYLAAPQPAHGTSATERVVDVGVERLREELHSAACLLETMAEALPEDDVKAVMMSVMAQRNRAVLDGETAPAPNAVTAGQGMEVKPLEWKALNVTDREAAVANIVLGKWEVWQFPGGRTYIMKPGEHQGTVYEDSYDAAKAYLERVYQSRIAPALSTPTPKEERK